MIAQVCRIPLASLVNRLQESYIMVCRSGGRSGRTTRILESKGYNTFNMLGGMLTWQVKVV